MGKVGRVGRLEKEGKGGYVKGRIGREGKDEKGGRMDGEMREKMGSG